MTDLLDALLTSPGRYVGPQTDPTATNPDGSVARIEVTPLPGGTAVSLAYEVLSPAHGMVHHEHAVLARTMGGLVLVTSHNHSPVTTVIAETEPGYFPSTEATSPFPMAIRLEVPEPGHLVYTWSYGWEDQPMCVRDIGDVRLLPG